MQDGCLAKTATNYEKHSSSGRNAGVPTIRKTARMTSQVPHHPQGEERDLTTDDTQQRHSPLKRNSLQETTSVGRANETWCPAVLEKKNRSFDPQPRRH